MLKALPNLINQTVGDALSDMLMVEAILTYRQWSLADWLKNTYTDLPSRQLKVRVKDRSVCKTEDADRRVASPAGVQDLIDALVKPVVRGRGFIR